MMSEEVLRAVLEAAKSAGVSRYTVNHLLESVYEVRYVCGFEVEDGWEMPEPPIPGAYACVDFHGSDGLSLYWWHDDWGKYPGCFMAWAKRDELGFKDSLEYNNPLVDPDTGSGYKRCMEAYRELGFQC